MSPSGDESAGEIAAKKAKEELFSRLVAELYEKIFQSDFDPSDSEVIEIPVSGRNNRDVSEKVTFSTDTSPRTVTEEVEIPVAGRSSGEPRSNATVERERVDPQYSMGDLTSRFSPDSTARAHHGHQGDDNNEVNASDAPVAGKKIGREDNE